MPNFVWRVRDKSGQTVVREITATNSIEAERVLISEGCTQLQLISDEIADVATSAMPKTITVLGEKVTITAQDREKAREKITRGRATFWRLLIETVVQSKALILIVVAYGAFQVYREHFIVAGLILLMLPAW